MPTSIRDLLTATTHHLQQAREAGRYPDSAADARATIRVAGRILTQLRMDGLHRDYRHDREQATTNLAQACQQLDPLDTPPGRAAQLLGAAGDAIATMRHDIGRADRWALTLALATVTRRAAVTYNDTGPYLCDPSIENVRHAAITLTRLGAHDPPNPRALAIQDQPIPNPRLGELSPLDAAVQASHQLRTALHHAATGRAPRLASYELRATAMTAHATAQYSAAVHRATGGDPTSVGHGAVHAWQQVRNTLAVFADGQRPDPGGNERILRAAAALHVGLRRRFGPADTASAAHVTNVERAAVATIADNLAPFAQELRNNLDRLHGRLIARADRLPTQESRIADRVHRATVIVGGADFADLSHALHSANTRSAALASDLRPANRSTVNEAATPPRPRLDREHRSPDNLQPAPSQLRARHHRLNSEHGRDQPRGRPR